MNWGRVVELFDRAVALDAGERRSFLDEACAGDADLRREVEALLRADEGGDDVVGSTIAEVAAEITGGEEETVEPAAGRRIGPYEIVKELGQGGMGAVFLAVRADDEFHRQVAIKVMHDGLQTRDAVLRFRSERQILADLDHPNIGRMLDGGTTDDDTPFVVMEYVDGEPIDRYCERKKLSTRERVVLFRKVCAAVHYAHRNLVVHRDLKPSNIPVDGAGEVKLLDFGIAKLLDPDRMPHTVAETGTAMRLMTPDYASPEQVRGEPITTASDVYALGVLLYELLTGVKPFRITSHRQRDLEQAICNTDPDRPSTVVGRRRRELEGDLDNIVLMAMRKEPERRYASVEQLSEDLRRYLEGRPVLARQDSFGYRARKFVTRHRFAVAGSAVLVVLLVAFGVVMAVQAARIATERDIAAAERLKAERALAFMTDVFRVSDPTEALGETVTARELLDRGAERLRSELADQPDVQSTLLRTIGEVYRNLGLFERSREVLEESVARTREAYGDESDLLARTVSELGLVLQEQGDHEGAERCFRESLAVSRALHEGDHPDVSAGLNNLALLHFHTGNYDEAEPLFRESLEMSHRLEAGETVTQAPTMDNLAQLLHEAGRYDEAEPLLRRALALREEALGPDHPRVLVSLNNLGSLLADTGDIEEAESLYRRSLEASARVQGEDHPEYATTLNNLAMLLDEKGDLEGAEEAYRQVLDVVRASLGEDHADYGTVLGNLAAVLRARGKGDEAERAYYRSLEIKRAAFGEDHLSVAVSMNNLAKFLTSRGRYDEAEPLYRKTLDILRDEFGEEHPYYAAGLGNLGLMLKDRGDLDAAGPMFERSLELARIVHGDEHTSVARGLLRVAAYREATGDLAAAETGYLLSIAMFRRTLPEGSTELADALVRFGSMEAERGNDAVAEPLLAEALEIRRASLGDDHADTVAVRELLGGRFPNP